VGCKQSASGIDKNKACSIETPPVSILQRLNCIKASCNAFDFAQTDFAPALMWSTAAPEEGTSSDIHVEEALAGSRLIRAVCMSV
jgi:hypothetical protein